MANRSRGRGVAAAFGFLLLVAGLIGAAVLYFMAAQRPDEAVKSFARAVPGCTTTLDFSDTGTFYVYEETVSAFDPVTTGCAPSPTPGQTFQFELRGPVAITPVADVSVVYDSGEYAGASVARFDITTPGTYEIAVTSENPLTVAAVGRDPDSGVDDLHRNAVTIGVIGVGLGLVLLLVAGWRSKKASTPSIPEGPGWGPRPIDQRNEWPSTPADVPPRVPINPQQPDHPVSPTPPPPPLPARAPGAGLSAASWSPPPAGGQPVSSDAPVPPPPPRMPEPMAVLPQSPPPPPTSPTPPPPPPPPPPTR